MYDDKIIPAGIVFPAGIFLYDYPFSTPTKNAVNKRIIERPISFPRLRRGKNILQET